MSYIGGVALSQNERRPFVERMRKYGSIAFTGWPWQCRCGTMEVVKYRGRYYCSRCGFRWTANPRTGERLSLSRREVLK